MTASRRSFLQRTGLGAVGGMAVTALTAVFPEFAQAAAPSTALCNGTDSSPCAKRCKCNNYKDGKCMKLGGGTLACWCTDDGTQWHTAPGTCR